MGIMVYVGALIGVSGIFFLMLSTSLDVIWRTTFGSPIRGVQDYSSVAMVLVVYLSLAYAEKQGSHVSFGLIMDRLSRRASSTLTAVGLAVSTAVLAWVVFATGQEAINSVARGEYLVGLARAPLWPARIGLTAGLILLCYQLLVRIWGLARAVLGMSTDKRGVKEGGSAS